MGLDMHSANKSFDEMAAAAEQQSEVAETKEVTETPVASEDTTKTE